MNLPQRFWAKVDKRGPVPAHRPELGPCWAWKSALDHGGYGVFWVSSSRRAARAHRLAYEAERGPIPEGLTLDHLCRNKACVNPAHLDPCTSVENAARQPDPPWARKARQTHCKRGHPFDERNTSIHNGRRECRACNAQRARERRARSAA